ncbi:MAG: type I pantothenate kinase [Methylobacteriaceae bacterium]|jgi:type I pantothenate kinase|nr:type I pantothenate kinase [Methylobacteriaceae bacterium]
MAVRRGAAAEHNGSDKPPSPYQYFSRRDWAKLRADTPMTLSAAEINQLRSRNDPISVDEVEMIYLPVSRLLSFYVESMQNLYETTERFLQTEHECKVPYIIGVAGSVAVGKSTMARVLKELLARWPNTPKVDLITTDGFLLPNKTLNEQNLMRRKGFPESYNINGLRRFLGDIKAGRREVKAPVYSHVTYDVVPGETVTIDRPDILIVEGLNVLQPARLPKNGEIIPFVSDYFDFSIYLDAAEADLRRWYMERFFQLRQTSFKDPLSYFHRYALLPQEALAAVGNDLWDNINLVNLLENILPTRQRADLILRKGADHRIEEVSLRRL